jgi:hypothetical protein
MLYKIKNGLIDIDSHQYIQSNDSRTRGKDRLYQERTASWFQSLMVLGKNKLPKASLLVLS